MTVMDGVQRPSCSLLHYALCLTKNAPINFETV